MQLTGGREARQQAGHPLHRLAGQCLRRAAAISYACVNRRPANMLWGWRRLQRSREIERGELRTTQIRPCTMR